MHQSHKGNALRSMLCCCACPPKKAELYTGDPESKVVEKGIKVVWL
jgi:hypothetical protein